MFYLFDKCSGILPPVKEVVTQSLKSKITDEVIMDVDPAYDLAHMILDIKTDEDGMETYIIPPDIILANTLPIKHFSFKMKNVLTWFEYHINDTYAVYHFENVNKNEAYVAGDHTMICEETVVSPTTIKDYFAADERTICVIGTVEIHQTDPDNPETTIILPLVIDNDNICYFNHEIVDIYLNGKSMKHIIPLDEHGGFDMKHAEDQVLGDAEDALMFFYVIECALLHPVIVEVFNDHSKKVPLNGSSSKKFKNNKRANIRYIKQIRIGSMQPIDEAFKKRGFIRKTMVWYVTGHWREYKSGKRIFIQGYWKGILRDSKTSETRDRSIVFIDENAKEEE